MSARRFACFHEWRKWHGHLARVPEWREAGEATGLGETPKPARETRALPGPSRSRSLLGDTKRLPTRSAILHITPPPPTRHTRTRARCPCHLRHSWKQAKR
ncbi:MAG: hypothetical protein LBK99_06300, partial [Opitutaceae bacterium]|nr:hypothetical protein [Opitutaceae bacterium]